MRLTRHVALFSVIVLSSPASAGAQTDGALPVPLVTALMWGARGTVASGSAQYFIDRVPPGFPMDLIPRAPAVAAGGQVSGGVTIAVFNDTSKKFLVSYLEQIQNAGYNEPPPPANSGFSSGFTPSGVFCKDSLQVMAQSAPGAVRGAYIAVQLRKTTYGPCVQPLAARARPAEESDQSLKVPTLLPPPEASSRRSGGGSGSDEVRHYATLQIQLPVSVAILRHYVAQLNAAGWSAELPLSSDHLSAVVLTSKDPGGRAWTGNMTVMVNGSFATVQLTMRPASDICSAGNRGGVCAFR